MNKKKEKKYHAGQRKGEPKREKQAFGHFEKAKEMIFLFKSRFQFQYRKNIVGPKRRKQVFDDFDKTKELFFVGEEKKIQC